MDKIKDKFNKSIDLSKSVEFIGYLIKKTQLTSVDFTDIYYGEFNYKRYLISLFHFAANCLGLICLFSFTYPLFYLFDNKYFPKNFQSIILTGLIDMILSVSMRLDLLVGEWENKLSTFKFYYYIENNIKSKHRLNESNYRKLGIYLKLFEVVFIKGFSVLMVGSVTLNLIYIAFRCDRITVQIATPFVIYWVCCISFAISLMIPLMSFAIYYYKLLFDQLNDQFEKISKSEDSTRIMNVWRLMMLIKHHNLLSVEIHKLNLFIRRTVGLLFIGLSLFQILPLHLILETRDLYEKLFFSQYAISGVLFGFGPALLLSMQIQSAHRPSKYIYSLLAKELPFHIKWKVFLY